MKNLLSIDFEAWFHFLGDSGVPSFETWNALDTRLEENTELLLELLEGFSATFFSEIGFSISPFRDFFQAAHSANIRWFFS